jgi:hypothetical protein
MAARAPVRRAGEAPGRLVETIIPETETPGAKKARVHVFVDLALRHCRTVSEQQTFVLGLGALDAECRARHGAAFVDAPTRAREDALQRLEAARDPFFALLKELTVLGYCTSEIGARQGLAYVAVPGEYRGCVELKPGQKTWATS